VQSRLLTIWCAPRAVAPDESSTYRVSACVDGWVRHVFRRTGTQVKRGERGGFLQKDISAPQQLTSTRSIL